MTETVEAINACNAAGVKLMIGLQRRFDQNFMRVRQAVQKNEVGTPIMIKLCSRDPAPPPFSYVKVCVTFVRHALLDTTRTSTLKKLHSLCRRNRE